MSTADALLHTLENDIPRLRGAEHIAGGSLLHDGRTEHQPRAAGDTQDGSLARGGQIDPLRQADGDG